VRGPRRRRWPARVLALLATTALLGSGAWIVVMVMPAPTEDGAAPAAPAATATPGRAAGKKRKPQLTATQRRARAAALATLTEQGYRPVRLRDYVAGNKLRVLIGRDDAGAQRAFFFLRREFIGHDDVAASRRVRVARARDRSVTLAYGLYEPGDHPCCPKGGIARVTFRWSGEALEPGGAIPPAALRVPAG
jgi:hypothetical protein